jgi:acyl dehydratase
VSAFERQLEAWRVEVMGRKREFEVGVIDRLWSQRYAVALDDLDPLYFDGDYARSQGYRGIIAPPNYVTTMRDEASSGPTEAEMRPDGLPLSAGPPVAGLAAMGGGQEIAFHEPVYCGERIVAEKQVVRVVQQDGRSGPMVIVEEEIRYRSDAGEAKCTLRNTVLYRVLAQEAGHEE